MLKLKLQYFGHLMRRADSLEKTLMLIKIEGDDRDRDGWMASPTQWTWVWASSRRWWRIGRPGVLQSMGSQRVRHDWATFTFIFPRSKCLLISWLQSPSTGILEPKKIKSVTVSIVSPSICPEVMGPDAMQYLNILTWDLSLGAFQTLEVRTMRKNQ